MEKLECPKCKTVFVIDDADYISIVNQIKDKEFDKQLGIREKDINDKKDSEIKLEKALLEKKYEEKLSVLENKISSLELELKNKDKSSKQEIDKISLEKKIELDSSIKDIESKYIDEVNSLKEEVIKLESDIKLKDSKLENEISKVVINKEKDINELKSKIDINNKEYELSKKNIIEDYQRQLKVKDDMIDYYKDLKLKASTKMIGETLEQHCNAEFSKIRCMFSPSTYFEKDNDAKTGSKGDFIFRDYDEDNNEFISIMFEMKNEADATSSKHKNEDFFKELDKDRREKNCEYAVLVSLLEKDNDIYNAGIVDVSYKYDKMYVIRPQFFVPIITLLRNASLKSLDYRKQLNTLKNQNIDISNFEDNINKFKSGFARNYQLASDKFKKAIEEIDKTIDHLQKTKDALISSENNLRLANNKADDLSIKRLAKGNETMKMMFEEMRSKKKEKEDKVA